MSRAIRSCSTPEGDTDFDTLAICSLVECDDCAQRPKATLISTPSAVKSTNSTGFGAQRPKATLISTHAFILPRSTPIGCAQRPKATLISTPEDIIPSLATRRGCSTPEGDTDFDTRMPSLIARIGSSAQRPKATLISTRQLTTGTRPRPNVLNARRRH